ncbi:MAG: tetratricopeptide repeat protein [Phycisphaerales bacterium]
MNTDDTSGAKGMSGTQPAGGMGGAVPLFVMLGVLLALVGGILLLLIRGAAGGGANSASAGTTEGSPAAAAYRWRVEKAHEAFVQGEYVHARGLLEELIAERPEEAELRLLMTQVECGLRDFAGAYKHIEAAIAIGPASPELHFDAGTIANSAGLTDRALEHYSMAQQAAPKEPRYPLYLAMIQVKLGQDGPAMASLVRAVNLAPDLAEAWGTMGELELKGNSLGLALDHLRKAKALQPLVARWRIGEARVLKRQGAVEEAAGLLAALDDADRWRLDVLETLGECFGLLGKPGEAAAQYARAAEGRAGSADEGSLHARAAEWFARAGDEDRAAKHRRRARDLGEGS